MYSRPWTRGLPPLQARIAWTHSLFQTSSSPLSNPDLSAQANGKNPRVGGPRGSNLRGSRALCADCFAEGPWLAQDTVEPAGGGASSQMGGRRDPQFRQEAEQLLGAPEPPHSAEGCAPAPRGSWLLGGLPECWAEVWGLWRLRSGGAVFPWSRVHRTLISVAVLLRLQEGTERRESGQGLR